MPDHLTLSQPAWTLIETLQQQLGVTIEVFDASMRPLAPSGGHEGSGVLAEPSLAAEAIKSLRNGEMRIDRTSGSAIAIVPLRIAKQVVGCLVVSPRRAAAAGVPVEANVEGAAHIARTALESDLALTRQLGESRARNRRIHGVLRFLAQIGTSMDERTVMHAVVQAATVWFDVDCRIYHRLPGDVYELAAALPGIERPPSGARLEKTRVDKLIASRRFASGGDLDDLGLGGRREEVLVLPIGDAAHPEWLLLLAGAIDLEVELTFAALARVLAGDLEARQLARLAYWSGRLAEARGDDRRAPERAVLTMLEALAVQAGAHAACVALITPDGERALAAFGAGEPGDPEPRAEGGETTTYVRQLDVAAGVRVRLTIESRGDARLMMVQADSWMRALQPWLREVGARLAAEPPIFGIPSAGSSFERRIQEEVERARRFNLGLGLVLIAPGSDAPGAAGIEAVVSAVRSELRASDLMGQLRSGAFAVLLVHAEPAGAESVIARIRGRLADVLGADRMPVLRLGRAVFSAECATAEELIARAHREAQSLESRN